MIEWILVDVDRRLHRGVIWGFILLKWTLTVNGSH